jgi:hypothetical protein
MEQFKYILENQALWAQQYNEQEKTRKVERIKLNKSKEWYGNSKEYRNEWGRQNKRKAVKQQSNIKVDL